MTTRMSQSPVEQQRENDAALGLSDALGLIAHDIRSSLAIVSGFATTLDLLWDRLDADRIHSALGLIADRANEIVAFADDLLDMGRAEDGRLELRYTNVEVDSLIDDAVRRGRADHPEHVFHAVAPPGLVLRGDLRRLAQVLMNLISNASKSAPSRSVIKVIAKRVADEMMVSVINPGRIPESMRGHLFEKFVSEDARATGGSGLGLYLCRLLVELHGGRIWVDESGGMTSFCMSIPCTEDGRN